MNKKKTVLVKLTKTVNNWKHGKCELKFLIMHKSFIGMEFLSPQYYLNIQKKVDCHTPLKKIVPAKTTL